MTASILVIGTFDSKAEEYEFLVRQIQELDCEVVCVDVGVLEPKATFPIDVPAAQVAKAGGGDLAALRSASDRGAAMKCMATGAAKLVADRYRHKPFDGIIGMGGSGGTSIITSAMRALPIGVPKLCVSTVASSDTSPYVGSKDVVLVPSVTDVSGINRISRVVFAQAAAAICGMAQMQASSSIGDRPIIVASMFGNTTECVNLCRKQLDDAGYEVLVFHAVGSGGRTLEILIEDGWVHGCLDITTTEWADQLCGGIFAAGEQRLSAAGRAGIPHLIVPGCIDMVNFGPIDTVPEKYRHANRLLYEWNPSVTLMRTNVEENRQLGEIFAQFANAAKGPVGFLLPTKGVSILDGDDERFCDREADQAMFDSLRHHLREDVPVVDVEANINDPMFAQAAADTMLQWLQDQNH